MSGHQLFLVMLNLRLKNLGIFNLQSTLDSGFFARIVRLPIFYGYSNFEVKNSLEFFNWQSTVHSGFFTGGVSINIFLVMLNLSSNFLCNFFVYKNSEFFRGGVQVPTFFGHTKFEVKNFSECFHLQSTEDSEFCTDRSVHQLFLVMLNLRLKIFWNFFVHRALWTLNFLQEESGNQLFLVTLNLRSKNLGIFSFIKHSGLWIFIAGGLWSPTFFGHAKFEVKYFLEFFNLQSATESEFFTGCIWAPTFFGHAKYEIKYFLEYLHLQSALYSEFFRWGVWAISFFGHAKFEVKNFSELFHLQCALDSEFFRGGVFAPTFFGHAKFEVKKF